MISLGAMKVAGCVLLLLAAVAAVLATDDHLFGTPEGRKYLQDSTIFECVNECLSVQLFQPCQCSIAQN